MSSIPTILAINLAIVLGLMFLLWLLSLALRDASIVDPFWGFGFVVLASTSYALAESPGSRGLLLTLLAAVWGLRLSGYLFWRNVGKGEDYRYREMRERHGDRFPQISLSRVFLFQGALMWIIGLPLQIGPVRGGEAGWLDGIGVLVWTVGMFFESVGDWQLARFKKNPANRGKVLDVGLWRYTRHPNYFGDFCVWWGMYLVAAAGGAWWTFFSPALMSFFLLKVSGVAMLEKTISDRRPAYREYIERTSAFLPLPPKPAA